MKPEIPIESFRVFAQGVDHAECIVFDRAGDLWAGGEGGQIYVIPPDHKVRKIADLGSFCAGLAFSPKDELLVCNPDLGIVQVTPSGKHSVFASHAGDHKIICANYGLFDAAGNYYVTDSGLWRNRNGFLLRFTPDGKGQVLAGPFNYPNGLALSGDGKTLYMVESGTNSVLRFEIGKGDTFGPAKILAEQCGRFPDGLTLDADGNLYVCCYASDEIWRIAPSGEKTLLAWDPWAIMLGGPTNMAFGGKDFDELYVANLCRTTITTVKMGRRGQPLANQKTV